MRGFAFLVVVQVYFLSTLVGSSTLECKADDNKEWSYAGKNNGPSAWGKTYEQCNGKMQSPIDIKSTDVIKDADLRHLELNNCDKPVQSAEVKNNGHTVMLTPKDGVSRTVSVGGDTYILDQLHFHWGSKYGIGAEHLLDSKRYALEAHFVHKTSDKRSTAVVGVLYQEADANNTGFNPISKVLSQIKFEGETTHLRSSLQLTKLLPRLPLQIFRYKGSLTTPDCAEGVVWSVAKDVITIGAQQLNELRSLFSVTSTEDHSFGCHLRDNYRPVQELNGRTVTESTSGAGFKKAPGLLLVAMFLLVFS